MRRRATAAALGLALGALAVGAPGAGAAQLIGSADPDKLVYFKSGSPGQEKVFDVTGLIPTDEIYGLDVRPETGELYALGAPGITGPPSGTSQLYVIELDFGSKTATATPRGARFATEGISFGFAFNPVVDRIRVISETNENRRVEPDTGVAVLDTDLAYSPNDENEGEEPDAVDAAYTNQVESDAPATTSLFDIDANLGLLVRQDPPNEGVLNTIGPLGLDVTNVGGFDITAGSGKAFAALQRSGETRTRLYEINLRTGKARSQGRIGGPKPLESLSVLPSDFPRDGGAPDRVQATDEL